MGANSLIISSDSHVVEPPRLWSDRMDAAHGDRIPHLEIGDPHDQWYCDGEIVGTLGGASSAGMRFSRPQDIILDGSFAQVPPGGYDPNAHVQDLDVDGVYASVLYSSVAGNMYAVPDANFLREVFTAYNLWLSEFCSAHPARLKGIAQVLVDDDMDAGIAQLEHAAELGLCGAMIPVFPKPDETYDLPMYEPLWAAAQDLGMPLSLHVGTKRPGVGVAQMRTDGKVTQSAAERSVTDYWVRLSLGAHGLLRHLRAIPQPARRQRGARAFLDPLLHEADGHHLRGAPHTSHPSLQVRRAAQRLHASKRVPRVPGGRTRHSAPRHHWRRPDNVGFRLPPRRVHLPRVSANPE